MSIESELERLNTAKADIAAAIQQKGVIVPELARLSDYPDFVESIPVHFSNAGCTASMRTDLTVPGTTGNPQLVLDTMDCSFGGCALQNGGIKIPENGYYLISASVLIKSGVAEKYVGLEVSSENQDDIILAYEWYFKSSGCMTCSPQVVFLQKDDIVYLYGRFENVSTEMVAKGSSCTKVTLIRVS